MLPWIFIHGYIFQILTKRPERLSFNAAMDFHPWIPRLDLLHPHKLRSFNVAMDFHPWILQDSHFNSSCQMSFNVAMDFHPWIPEYCPLTQTLHDPLQCCHGFSSMDTTTADTSFQPLSSLQCCHGFSSMDTRVFLHSSMVRTIASMLPWIFIHGY